MTTTTAATAATTTATATTTTGLAVTITIATDPTHLELPAALVGVSVFETVHPVECSPRNNEIQIHGWGRDRASLPAGATEATITVTTTTIETGTDTTTATAATTTRMPACLRPHISPPVAWAPLGSR